MAREKTYKKCPRCGEKTFQNIAVCDNCKLVFSRLEHASNKRAKKEIKLGNRQNVIKTKQLPKDVSFWKLLLVAFFGGLVGAHNIWLGRYVKGFFAMFGIIVLCGLILLVPSAVLAAAFSKWLFVPYGLITFFWLYDILMIACRQYKVPIALDLPANGEENGKK